METNNTKTNDAKQEPRDIQGGCVCCGGIVPEGRQVCPNCEAM